MGDKDRYRLFFEVSQDAMLTIRDGHFVDGNQAALNMLGLSNIAELTRLHPGAISPAIQPDGRNSFEKAEEMIALAHKNTTHKFDWLHQDKEGETFPVEVLLISDPDEQGQVINVVWRDISHRFDLENAMFEMRLLGAAVNQSAASTLITDINGRIEYINPAFTKINGYTLEEVRGKTPGILNSGLQSDEFYQDMWKTIKSGERWVGTLRNVRKNGEKYWARLKISPVKDDTGEILKFIGIETDITDFIDAKEKAENANKAKSEFLSAMSHELRTPLNSILGFSQLLELDRSNPLSERQTNQVAHIFKAGTHLLNLIDEILDLAKLEAGKMAYNISEFDPNEILDDCISFIDTAHAHMEVRVVDDLEDLNVRVRGDVVRLRQIILNLLSNAKKYNRKGGEIHVRNKIVDNKYLRVSVADTGQGIPAELQNQVFQPFNRIGAEKSDIEGTGIGLVLTKMMAEEMGGRLDFTSVEGEGSCFWVDMEIVDRDRPKKQDIHIERQDFSLYCCDNSHRLLYIEDNPMNRDLMAALVEQIPNLEMVSAENAFDGIKIATELQPHLILMDINLPDIDGFQAFEKLREIPQTASIPVVALSANAMPETIKRANSLGFKDYVTKPFSFGDMLRVFDTHIDN